MTHPSSLADRPETQHADKFIASSFSNAAGTRAYKTYLPQSRSRKPRPLLVMLHGCTQDPEDFAAGTRMNALADRHDFAVVYPAQSSAANGMRCWNWFTAKNQVRDQGEPSLIAGIVRKVVAEHALDQKRIFIVGMSAGGAMAAILAETYGDLFAGLGVHSGLPYAAAHNASSALVAMKGSPLRPVTQPTVHIDAVGTRPVGTRPADGARSRPTIVFHGDDDTTVDVSNGAAIVEQAVAREEALHADLRVSVHQGESVDGCRYATTVYRGAAQRPLIEYWVLNGAGHAWSGGSSAGSFTREGGPCASAEMVRFFSL